MKERFARADLPEESSMSETTLKDRILDDLRGSMKARDQIRLDTLRGVKARIQEKEVERRAKEGLDYALDDDGVLQVLAQAAKQRRDSIDSFRGSRTTYPVPWGTRNWNGWSGHQWRSPAPHR